MGEEKFSTALKDVDWLQPQNAIIIGWRGSISHGMYVPQNKPDSIDDKDIMSIVIPDIFHYFGLKEWGTRGTKELFRGEWDCVGYELKKFVSLLIKGNPNVLGMLWLEPNYYLHLSESGKMLIENRELFVSKQAYHAFSGYAYGQLHRMTHYKFEGYMGKKRKAFVDKYGYDCKNAAHLIRLLRMGIEFMVEGKLHVLRQDAQQLLEIKRGEWSLENVKNESDRLFKLAEESYIKSSLPNEVDYEKINDLVKNILLKHFCFQWG